MGPFNRLLASRFVIAVAILVVAACDVAVQHLISERHALLGLVALPVLSSAFGCVIGFAAMGWDDYRHMVRGDA